MRMSILFAVVILAMGHQRFFCKVICPLGACLSMFNRFAAIFPERTTDCTECGTCNQVCRMQTQRGDAQFGVYNDRAEECIACLDCKDKCPTEAIRLWGA